MQNYFHSVLSPHFDERSKHFDKIEIESLRMGK